MHLQEEAGNSSGAAARLTGSGVTHSPESPRRSGSPTGPARVGRCRRQLEARGSITIPSKLEPFHGVPCHFRRPCASFCTRLEN